MRSFGIWDFVCIIYFASHIPITLGFDAQSILPTVGIEFPKPLSALLRWYCAQYADPLMCSPPTWFRAICWVELLVQTPFFFVALVGWLRRAEWLRAPLIAYGAHVATTLIPIYGALLEAWQQRKLSDGQFQFLAAVYMPYFIIPFALMIWAGRAKSLFGTSAAMASGSKKAN